jgi:hypothetical protein
MQRSCCDGFSSNNALDKSLHHLVKGLPLPCGVNIPLEILDKFEEGQDFFACMQCPYVGDRKYHARLHVLRIHVRKNSPILCKRKFVENIVGEDRALLRRRKKKNEENAPRDVRKNVAEGTRAIIIPKRLWMPLECECFYFGEWNRASKAVQEFFAGVYPPLVSQEFMKPTPNFQEEETSVWHF